MVQFLQKMKVVKANKSGYPCIPASKLLHIFNPSLFPIYDDTRVWDELMHVYSKRGAMTPGVFADEYEAFCKSTAYRGLPLYDDMKPVDRTEKFNANYTFWARKYMVEMETTLMPIFGEWFRRQTEGDDDPYKLRSRADTFYGLAFEVVALGAGRLERHST